MAERRLEDFPSNEASRASKTRRNEPLVGYVRAMAPINLGPIEAWLN